MKEIVCVHAWRYLAEDVDQKTGAYKKIQMCDRCHSSWNSSDPEPEAVLMRLKD